MSKIPRHIKNIIFDLGEVITDIHFHRTEEAFNKLALSGKISLYTYKTQTPLFDLLETGKISEEHFIAELKKQLKPDVSNQEILDAWNAMLGETPLHRLEFVQSLSPKYNTFVLSNTNAIHINNINNYLKTNYKQANLDAWFDKAYFSHEIGFRKPEPECYQFVLDREQLHASETLFIDDKIENVEGARRVGMMALQLENKEELKSWF